MFEGSGLLARSDIADLPLLTSLEVGLAMNLRASTDGTAALGSAAPVASRSVPNTKCAWDQGWKVSDARAEVKQLAQVAGNLKDDTIWTQYYNGPQAIRDALDRADANIESYRQEVELLESWRDVPPPLKPSPSPQGSRQISEFLGVPQRAQTALRF